MKTKLLTLCFLLASMLAGAQQKIMVYQDCAKNVDCYLDNGTIGDDFVWKLNCDNELYINGNGDMPGVIREESEGNGAPEIYFKGKRLAQRIIFADGITGISHSLYYSYSRGCQLREIVFPEGLTFLGRAAFTRCDNLEAIIFPESLEHIGAVAFAMCSQVEAVTIPENVNYIGDAAFAGCLNLQEINVVAGNEYFKSEDGVLLTKDGTRLRQYPMGKTNTLYRIPNSVTTIDDYAFHASSTSYLSAGHECALTSVVVPATVRTIGIYAFGSDALTSITMESSTPPTLTPTMDRLVGEIGTLGCSSNCIIYIPNGSMSTYLANPDWAKYENQLVEIDNTPSSVEMVDLGLSVKWANMNVGATAPEEYGLYFAWGETQGYTSDTHDGRSFDWASYKWCNGSDDTMTKYCTESSYGTVDNKTVLDPEDDAAHVNWGGSWRMPTHAEQQELIDNCTVTWTDNYNGTGVAGSIFTSNSNGNSIFLPAASWRNDTSLSSAGSNGYWSSSLHESSSDGAQLLVFLSSSVDTYHYGDRGYGLSVRPVCH